MSKFVNNIKAQIGYKNLKMKRFQEVLKEKAHINKIRNAKKTISVSSKVNTSKLAVSKINDEAKLLLHLYQNKSFDSIPAYKLLRTAGLQQYTKQFIIRGYGINLGRLGCLTEQQKKLLYQDLKVLPGHSLKLDKIIKAIVKQSYQEVLYDSYYQQSEAESTAKSIQKDKTVYSNMGKKRGSQEDQQYKKQLQRVLNQYTPPLNSGKQKSSYKLQKRESLLSTGQPQSKYNKTKYMPPRPIIKPAVQCCTSTNTDIKRRNTANTNQGSSKTSVRKNASHNAQVIGHKQNKVSCRKQQSAGQSLNRLLQGVTAGSVIESQKVMEMDLQLNRVKDLYRSFDGAVMSSTIANLDVQELVYAFAGYVADRVIAAPQPPKSRPNQEYSLNLKSFKLQPNQQHSHEQQPIQEQIGSILRQSYLHPLYRQAFPVQDNIQCDEVNSEGQNQQQEDQLPDNQFSHKEHESGDGHMMQSSFLGTKSYQFGLDKPVQIFEEPEPTQIDYFKPTVDSIFNFIKNIVLSAKMQRQIPVMAASYLDTFLQKSRIPLTSLNYKRLLIISLLLASKIWDDQSFQTPSFSKTFPEYSTILLNEMQKQILGILQYKLKLDKRQYALVYFKLRKFIKKNIKSYQNRKLNIKKIRQLQNGTKTQYKSNFLTKRNSF